MSSTNEAPVFKTKIGHDEELQEYIPGIGEMMYDIENKNYKIGNKETKYKDLPFLCRTDDDILRLVRDYLKQFLVACSLSFVIVAIICIAASVGVNGTNRTEVTRYEDHVNSLIKENETLKEDFKKYKKSQNKLENRVKNLEKLMEEQQEDSEEEYYYDD